MLWVSGNEYLITKLHVIRNIMEARFLYLAASGFRRYPLLFFSTLEECLEFEFTTSTIEKMLPIVSKFIPSTERLPAVRIREYAECIVPSYSDGSFRSHFQCRNFGGSFSSLSRSSKSAPERTTSSECRKAITHNTLGFGKSRSNTVCI